MTSFKLNFYMIYFEVYQSNLLNVYAVKIDNQLFAISVSPLINIYGVAFILENYFYDFIPNKLFGGVIPFYGVAYELLLSRFMNLISNKLTQRYIPNNHFYYIK